ncbi:MAG TPA: T9SS type A sorting domain-containing protein [Bacteroidia bacterium]|nr:T9SS type A sorting domain-containing protein [Bacteroidia bacterium]
MKSRYVFFQIFLIAQLFTFSQTSLTFEAYDRFGQKYALEELNTQNDRPIGGLTNIHSIPTQTCNAGYFNLYFASGSYFDGNSSAQQVLCQLFLDLSNFLPSPSTSNGTKVNIYCTNTPSAATNALGAATGFYVFPAGANSANQGILDNQIYKTIISGIDSYSALPTSFQNATNFYHGMVQVNPNPPSGTWNLNMAITNLSSGQYDLYSVMLHEASHALGFESLINSNGNSVFGATDNYFSRYDQFLQDYNGNPLISSSTASTCPNSNITFASTLSVIASSTSGCVTDVSTCSVAAKYVSPSVNVKVYTPNCFESGSSLSHFEDMCTIQSTLGCATSVNSSTNNNLYYVLANSVGTGSCYVKRYLRPDEKNVFCDIGYSVNSTYGGTLVAGSSYTYTGACNGPGVWGMHDGLSNAAYSYTAILSATNAIGIQTAAIISNDSPNTASISCISIIYGSATASLSASGASLDITSTAPGLVVIRYLPESSSNKFGSPTYIYAYFLPAYCSPANPCDLVQNGGFENNVGGIGCGWMFPNSNISLLQPWLSCWEAESGTPDYYSRNCTLTAQSSTSFNLGTNVLSTTLDSYNGSPNNAIIGLGTALNGPNSESMKTILSSPLIPNQSYQLEFWVYNPSTPIPGGFSVMPIVLSIKTMPSITFIGTQTILANFTVQTSAAWQHISQLITFTAGINHNALSISFNNTLTGSLNALGSTPANLYCFLDDLSIKTAPTPTFSIPNANSCGSPVLNNLAQYASAVNGTFTGVGVTTSSSGTVYNFNAQGTLTSGAYPIGFTYTTSAGCTNTIWESVVISTPPNISVNGPTLVCSNASSLTTTLSASSTCTSCAGSAYFWQPGYIVGTNATFSLSANSVYTVCVMAGSCLATQTVAVNISTSCCSNSITPFIGSTLSSTLNGTYAINNDVLIPSGSSAMLVGNYLIAPDVKIYIDNSALLQIKGAHLYACEDMWNGIQVLNGGKLIAQSGSLDNLIEDAITAIDLSNNTTSTVTPILTLDHTVFNKNYIDINVLNYKRSSATYSSVLSIKNCVFTCRNLTFTNNAWPQAGFTSTSTAVSADLRFETASTSGLASPYLSQNNFTITNLKNPYSNRSSRTAIQLEEVGLTGTNVFYGVIIGDISANDLFNLFDAHDIYVHATNTNMKLQNNVFQNTNDAAILLPGQLSKSPTSAILANVTNAMNTNLDLTAATFQTGNRFWNCHRSIEGYNTYRFNIEKGLFRSQQSTANINSSDVGRLGISLRTNRFQYYLKSNEFTNIANCINIPIVAGNFTSQASSTLTQYGIYAANITLEQNTISIGSGTGNYINNAIALSVVNQANWAIAPDYTASTANRIGIKIENNLLQDVYRGIRLQGVTNFTTNVSSNTISVVADNVFNTTQHGIELSQSLSGNNVWGQFKIDKNSLTGAGVNTGSANPTSLVYCSMNTGLAAPNVICNSVSESYQGFVFSGMNTPSTNITGTRWFGNSMENLTRGMVLTNTGVIGQQGVANNGMGNFWYGSWPGAGASYGIWTYTSVAANSPLWVTGTTTPVFPPYLSGNPFNTSYGFTTTPIQTTTINAGYSCTDPSAIVISGGNSIDYASDEHEYIVKTGLYRFLHINDSVMEASSELESFYDDLSGSSIDNFMLVEGYLFEGNFSAARSTLNNITPENQVETNYKNFYILYVNYEENLIEEELFSNSDSTDLGDLCFLCPEVNGSCVIQARSLYNAIYNLCSVFPDCEESSGERKALILKNQDNIYSHLEVHPNPTDNKITIFSSSGILSIEILDITGRRIAFFSVENLPERLTLNTELSNGMYFVRVINGVKKQKSNKLIIAK